MTDHPDFGDIGWDPDDDLPAEPFDLPADGPDPLGLDPAGDPAGWDTGPAGDRGYDVPAGAGYPEADLSELGDLSGEPGGDGYPPADPAGGLLLQDWPVGADPDPVGEPAPFDPVGDPLGGPLPEPVDGFPWTDPDLLGGAPIGPLPDPVDLPDPAGLAGYAGIDLPPDADPWAVLAASDDPATNALARWWAPDPPPAI